MALIFSFFPQLAQSYEQVEVLRQDADVQVGKLDHANEYAFAAQSALKELQEELAAECLKTQELLAKAEWLVLSSSYEEADSEKFRDVN